MTRQLVTAAAALVGGLLGLLVPRPVYKLAVAPEKDWRTSCPAGHPVAWAGLARCRDCRLARAGRSGWYGPNTPATAALSALVCASLAHASGLRPELAVWLLLAPALLLLCLVDIRAHRLPDVVSLPLAATTLVLLGAAAFLPRPAGSFTIAVLGALALGGGYFILFLISPRSLGFGDVKLALPLGAMLGWYGWPTLALGALAGQLLAGLYGLGLLLLRKATLRTAVPYGPFMTAGAFLALTGGACGTLR